MRLLYRDCKTGLPVVEEVDEAIAEAYLLSEVDCDFTKSEQCQLEAVSAFNMPGLYVSAPVDGETRTEFIAFMPEEVASDFVVQLYKTGMLDLTKYTVMQDPNFTDLIEYVQPGNGLSKVRSFD